MSRKHEILVVGAGFAGAVTAEQLAATGKRILIIDKRRHVGGNAYDEYDGHGVLMHPFGPHIFHTNSHRIFKYLSNFTEWRFYEHRSRSMIDGTAYPLPINQDTINRLYGLSLNEQGIKDFFEKAREPRTPIRTSEDVVLNSVGRDLYDKFYRNYIRKQWDLDATQLSASVAARIPVRTNQDDRYFDDEYQFMPNLGYTSLFLRMLDNPRIRVELNVDFSALDATDFDHVVYTGPIDAYFSYCYGRLPYRSMRFQHEYVDNTEFFQPVGQVNYPNEHAYTRVTEFKHLSGQKHRGTSICREIPSAEGEPYYPVPRSENELLYKRYSALASQTPNVTFVGRLAQYRYYNMDQVVGAALKAAQNILEVT